MIDTCAYTQHGKFQYDVNLHFYRYKKKQYYTVTVHSIVFDTITPFS